MDDDTLRARWNRRDGSDGEPAKPAGDIALPRTERPDAPAYLRAYAERRARGPAPAEPASDVPSTNGERPLPLYLRRFRSRSATEPGETRLARPALDDEPPTFTEAWASTSRSRELVLPPDLRSPSSGDRAVVDVHLVRHGETQGYSVNAGLTPMGRWQAQRRGHDLSKRVRDGEFVRIVCAPTPRAIQTGEQLRRGLDDGLALWGRSATVEGPEPMAEFLNFQVRTPSGEKDVTSAFREYHALAERFERVAMGDRPLWLVEIDRFFRLTMGGGDPIQFWMTTPLMTFEPATSVVLRFWAGIARLVADTPDPAQIVVAGHSGPMRALATWALGHDAGEPHNTEEVRLKVRRSLAEAQVMYRNRSVDIHVPPASEWPSWWAAHPSALELGAAPARAAPTGA